MTSKACPHGHTRRSTSNGSCLDCNAAYMRRWNAANREEINEQRRVRRAVNREHINEQKRAWRLKNADRVREQKRQSAERHREKVLAARRADYHANKAAYIARKNHRRGIAKLAQPKWVDPSFLRIIYDACPAGHHVDHIIPLLGENVCGLHVPHNLQYLAAAENRRKGNRMAEEH